MAKSSETAQTEASTTLTKAAKDWRAAKKRERAARDDLAQVVQGIVTSGILSENRVARITGIPRMTIRKMLGKG